MATLQAHGKEIGRIEQISKVKAYFANGDILVNRGFGWKVFGKVKAGNDPAEVFAKAKAYQEKVLAERPHFANYRREVMAAAGISKRWKLVEAIRFMPDDPDGVWSEVADGYGDNIHLSVDEVVDLCRLYKLHEAEALELGKVE